VLHFGWAHPEAPDFQHVVRSSGEPVEAIVVLVVVVTGPNPVTLDRRFSQFMPVPVERTRRIALDQQAADLARCHGQAVFIDQSGLVSWHRNTARAGPRLATP